jgi:methylmalonyl-CoA/ethylmalonyl-CoA epimerase
MRLDFHHLGVACSSLEDALKHYSALGYTQETEIFIDTLIGIKCVFVTSYGSPRLELCEALPGSEVLNPWLAHGSPIYHMAFKIETSWKDFVPSSGEKIVFGPVPAVAFENNKVWFTLSRNRQLVEYIANE